MTTTPTDAKPGDLIFTKEAVYQVVSPDEALAPGTFCVWTDKWVRTHTRHGRRWTSTEWHQPIRGANIGSGVIAVYGFSRVLR